MVAIRFAYDDHDEWSKRTGHGNDEPSKTQQQFAEDADINTIVKRFNLTGQLPGAGSVPLVTNGDFVEELSYREAMDIVLAGERSFAMLPADVRSRFGNDAATFVDFASDEANYEECVKLGLAMPKVKGPDPGVSEAPKASP